MSKPNKLKRRFIGPVLGEGATMHEASAAAMTKAVFALNEMDKEPLFGNFRGLVFYARPMTDGAAYGFVVTPDKGWGPHDICYSSGSRISAFAKAASHAVQYCWQRDMDDLEVLAEFEAIVRPHCTEVECRAAIQSLSDWFVWQRKYLSGIAQGMASEEAIDFANGLRKF